MRKILMTGHLGLVGRYLKPLLESKGYQIHGFDIANGSGDVCHSDQLKVAMADCIGVIHLAAVSRVIWGEQNPELCWQTNAYASEALLQIALHCPSKPWVLVASSREVYGNAHSLPVKDTDAVNPINTYGRAKAYMEEKALAARASGLNTAVIRLANVYGCIQDHADRVLPAFCRNAVNHKELRIDGLKNLFDFTHVSDVVKGLLLVVEQLEHNERNLPPTHLLPGVGLTLGEAAHIAIEHAQSSSGIIEAASRHYDVSRFVGDPSQAKRLLGWQATIFPEEGIRLLVDAFKEGIGEMAS